LFVHYFRIIAHCSQWRFAWGLHLSGLLALIELWCDFFRR
jgi:hypothetical protein